MPHFVESGLDIDFPRRYNALNFEKEVEGIHGMQPVDFIFQQDNCTILLEVKNLRQRSDLNKVAHGTLAREELVPKARDTYTYLHLMGKDVGELLFVFLVESPMLPKLQPLFPLLNNTIINGLRQEGREPWARQYIKRPIIMTPKNFTTRFKGVTISPVS